MLQLLRARLLLPVLLWAIGAAPVRAQAITTEPLTAPGGLEAAEPEAGAAPGAAAADQAAAASPRANGLRGVVLTRPVRFDGVIQANGGVARWLILRLQPDPGSGVMTGVLTMIAPGLPADTLILAGPVPVSPEVRLRLSSAPGTLFDPITGGQITLPAGSAMVALTLDGRVETEDGSSLRFTGRYLAPTGALQLELQAWGLEAEMPPPPPPVLPALSFALPPALARASPSLRLLAEQVEALAPRLGPEVLVQTALEPEANAVLVSLTGPSRVMALGMDGMRETHVLRLQLMEAPDGRFGALPVTLTPVSQQIALELSGGPELAALPWPEDARLMPRIEAMRLRILALLRARLVF